jgi:glycosyltransferase involved in cell wall biosynthesis
MFRGLINQIPTEESVEAQMSTVTVSQTPEVSIVLPVYRNVETLHELYRRLCNALDTQPLSYELLFVDDACPEGSIAVLEELARLDRRVGVLALERNVGQHRAVLAGLAYARGQWIVVMDADLQDPPEVIPDLLDKLQEGRAAVFAGRRGRYESTFRLFTSRLFKGLLRLLCGVPIEAGLFVALNRPMVERLLALGGPHPFVVAMIGCTGLSMASIPVMRDQRARGQSAYSFWGRLQSGWRAVAWVLSWRWRAVCRISPCNISEAPVKAYIGSRFELQAKDKL